MDLVELAKKNNIEGFMHPNELEKLVELAAGRDCLEVGSFKGLSAYCIAFTAKSLLCVDTFKANSAGQTQLANLTTFDEFRKSVSRYNNVKWYIGSSSDAAMSIVDTFDFIFLDAMHTYEEVKLDIKNWLPKLRSGGVMAFHDYGHSHFLEVQQAVDEVFGPIPEKNRVVTLAWVERL